MSQPSSEPLNSSTTPLPFTGTTSENTFTTSTNPIQLYTKTWTPSSPSSTHLIFLHGFSDHINAYYNLFPILASPPYNITVHGFDQRGWGRSVPDKTHCGLTGSTELVLNDIQDFHAHVSHILREQHSHNIDKINLFLGGHSMGGAEALTYMLIPNPAPTRPLVPITGLLLEAPHIAFPRATQPSALLIFSGRLASRFLPNTQMLQRLAPDHVSRDPIVVQQWQNDPLCHDTGTLAGLAGLIDRAEKLNALSRTPPAPQTQSRQSALADSLPCPVFWAHGTGDLICDFAGSQRLFARLTADTNTDHTTATKSDIDGSSSSSSSNGNRITALSEFKTYSDHYHKLHCEPNGAGEQFAHDMGAWICRVADPGLSLSGVTAGSASAANQSSSTSPSAVATTTGDGSGIARPDSGKSRL